ncbi:MAG: hypothetical protein WBB07_17495 [Mycobacterium sp.]
MSERQAILTRPNGKPYTPRFTGLQAHLWENHNIGESGVIIFGTLDPDQAHDLAVQMCRYWYGVNGVGDPQPGWYRNGFQNGERWWIRDDVRGRPGVMFEAVDR